MAKIETLRGDIAEEYYLSNTVQFGQFRLSVHNDNPDLPLSPWYLHYPKPGEPGDERLPRIFGLVGIAFKLICDTNNIAVTRIAGVPKGALPLGEAHASHYDVYPTNVVEFGKIQHENGTTEFTGPDGDWNEGDELVIDEDHTLGGRNKKLIRAAAIKKGFVVNHMLTVVDREQGGVQSMAELGVSLHDIMTATQLLDHGVHNGHIQQATMDEIIDYKNTHQL